MLLVLSVSKFDGKCFGTIGRGEMIDSLEGLLAIPPLRPPNNISSALKEDEDAFRVEGAVVVVGDKLTTPLVADIRVLLDAETFIVWE